MPITELAGLHARGKVRDIFQAGPDLLMVATDHISAFDVVLPTPIPGKGQVLTGLSLHWFRETEHLVSNHLLTADVDRFPPPFSGRLQDLAVPRTTHADLISSSIWAQPTRLR